MRPGLSALERGAREALTGIAGGKRPPGTEKRKATCPDQKGKTVKKWYRWQDYATVAAGLFTAIAVLWTRQQNMSTTFMLLFGGLLIISGIINLAMPGTPVVEYAQAVLAALLILSPWLGSYTGATGAAWTSWIAGAVALVVTAAAIKPSTEAHHNLRMSH